MTRNQSPRTPPYRCVFYLVSDPDVDQYAHRMFGRALGVIYGVPLLYLGVRGRIPPHIRGRLAALFALGGGQGLVGWWMVKSGLEVQYVLGAHSYVYTKEKNSLGWVGRRGGRGRNFLKPSMAYFGAKGEKKGDLERNATYFYCYVYVKEENSLRGGGGEVKFASFASRNETKKEIDLFFEAN